MPPVQYICLFAGEWSTNNTNNEWDGEYRTTWPVNARTPFENAHLEIGVEFDDADTITDFQLHDYTESSNVVTTGNISSDSTRETVLFDPLAIEPGNEVGLRINNTTASGNSGTEAHAVANVVLRP